MTDSILKSRDITLLTKVHLVKAMIFPVVMYGCESWTMNANIWLSFLGYKATNIRQNCKQLGGTVSFLNSRITVVFRSQHEPWL